MSKDWTSVLGDALGECVTLRGHIVGGVCERGARSAVESFVQDGNFFMPKCDAIELAASAAGTDWVDEMGGFAEVAAGASDLADLCETIASGTAYRLVYAATMAELDDLLETLDDVETDGYSIWAMGTGSSNLGWLPHQSETDAYGGTLAYWRRPEGGPDAWELHLTVGDTRVWFSLSKEADEVDADEAA